MSATTKILYSVDNVINAELQFFSNSKSRIDTCMNYTRPSLAISLKEIRKAFTNAKSRGVKLRYLTEITHDNISPCKELLSIVDELRHLDGVKGSFMVSESQYLAPMALFENEKVASQIVCSTVKEIVEHQQNLFDNLWSKAISAEQRFREIEEEEGDLQKKHYQTRLLESPEEVTNKIKQSIKKYDNNWSICSTFDGLLMMASNEDFEMQRRLLTSNRRGKNTRWVGTINKDNVHIVKAYLGLGMEIKHIKGVPPMSFAVSSKELYATIDEMKGGQIAKNLLVSNEPHYVKHYNSLFEELWKNGIDATDRIRDIEVGVDLADIEVIQSSAKAQERYLNLVRSAKEEILWIFPTVNAFIRQDKMGAIPLAIQAARERNVKLKILMPANDLLEQKVQQLKQYCPSSGTIDVRYIEERTSETKATILVLDRKDSMVMELKDDTKPTFYEAIGLSTYSNSKAGVLSYVAIFEKLWKQSELYDQLKEAHEQLKIHDKMQKEFIDIAAHELRTPIQPIISLSEVVLYNTKDIEHAELLEVINRNAKRLRRLTEDILDVTKIESQSLNLKREYFNLNDVITDAIDDIITNKISRKTESDDNNNNAIKLLYEPQDLFVYADKGRISQVILNLLDNAVKFAKDKDGGTITIMAEKREKQEEGEEGKHKGNQQVIVNIKDTGIGIDPQILPRLFTKFATKPQTGGTGLGLFICKGIIEAHDGKIWAENNQNQSGASFSFSLPTVVAKNSSK